MQNADNDLAQALDRRQWAQELHALMTRLPHAQRTALQLIYGGRLTHRQAASRARVTNAVFTGHVADAMRAVATHQLDRRSPGPGQGLPEPA